MNRPRISSEMVWAIIGVTIGLLIGSLIIGLSGADSAGPPRITKIRELHYDGSYGGWMAVCVGHKVIVSAHSSTIQVQGVSC